MRSRQTLPEEQDKQLTGVLALLRQAYRMQPDISEHERKEALQRVQDRLTSLKDQPRNELEYHGEEIPGSFVSRNNTYPAHIHKGFRPVLRTLVAFLLASLLLGSTLLFYSIYLRPAQQAATKQFSLLPTSAADTALGQQAGLEFRFKMTPGPYFLGELLAVDLALTNRSQTTYTLYWPEGNGFCFGSDLFLQQSGGTAPSYQLFSLPIPFIINCPAMRDGSGPVLRTGQTFTAHLLFLLTSSGRVTITGQVSFYLGQGTRPSNPGPLAGHLPQLQIVVSPQVRADRTLLLHKEHTQVVILDPSHLQLFAQTYLICRNADGRPEAAGTGHVWESLSVPALSQPSCNGIDLSPVQWNYAIGAVGYEVIQGQQGNYSGAA